MTNPGIDGFQWPFLSPGRLWSLWDMKDWDGPGLSAAQTYLISVCQLLVRARTDQASVPMDGPTVAEFRLNVEQVRKIAAAHDLDVLKHAADELAETLTALRAPDTYAINIDFNLMHQILPRLDHVVRSINHSLRGRRMFALTVEGQRLYENASPLFGQEVHDKFPTSRDEIAEAGKCLALRRNKAMVFHLMLAMEAGVRAISDSKGIALLKPTGEFYDWGTQLSRLKSLFIDKLTDLDEQQKWTSVHSLLWTVKEAWRNPTMHPAAKYTDEEAEEVFSATRAFLRGLAPLV